MNETMKLTAPGPGPGLPLAFTIDRAQVTPAVRAAMIDAIDSRRWNVLRGRPLARHRRLGRHLLAGQDAADHPGDGGRPRARRADGSGERDCGRRVGPPRPRPQATRWAPSSAERSRGVGPDGSRSDAVRCGEWPGDGGEARGRRMRPDGDRAVESAA